jgi:hypothetical protein
MGSQYGKKFQDVQRGVLYANNLVDNVTQLSNDPNAVVGITKDIIRGARNGGFQGVLGAIGDNLFRGTSDEDRMLSAIGSRGGLARSNRWLLEFTLPNRLSSYSQAGRDASIFCRNVKIPGKQLLTHEAFGDFRRPQKLPYQYALDDADFTFLCPNDMVFRKMFDDWMNIPVNPDTNFAEYYGEYAANDVGIIMQNQQNNEIYKVILQNAYPISVTSIELTHEQNGLVEITVSLTYRTLKYQSIEASSFSIFGIDVGTGSILESIFPNETSVIRKAAGIYNKLPISFR